jgi:hypothetical protein
MTGVLLPRIAGSRAMQLLEGDKRCNKQTTTGTHTKYTIITLETLDCQHRLHRDQQIATYRHKIDVVQTGRPALELSL